MTALGLPWPGRDGADEGYDDGDGMEYVRLVAVDPDGTVWAWDEVAECYTRCHSLTEAQQAEARRLAEAEVRS